MSGNWLLATALLLFAVTVSPAQEESVPPSGLAVMQAAESVLTDAIARAEDSVVAIARVRREKPGETFGFELQADPFGRRILPTARPEPTDPDFIPTEFGTGVLIDRRGLILTAYHVLGEDSDYYVTTHDRRVYTARIQGADPRSDLAVLAIDAENLTPITFGDAGDLRKGQIVIALGNPYAIARDGQASASWGIVSNLARKAPPLGEDSESADRTLHQFGTLIQTDARLNLGTSGGALLNLRGEMIGLTVSLAATPGYEQQAGYAIPIDATFRRIVDTLKEGREVEYGFLGIVPRGLARQDVLSGKRGARVADVVMGTPAEDAGLIPDDLIVAVDGQPVVNSDDLMLELGRIPVDGHAQLTVERRQEEIPIDVTLSKYPLRGWKVVTQRPPDWRGVRVDYPTAQPELNREPVSFFRRGVMVMEVDEGKPAWAAGLRPGMIVTQVDRKSVRKPSEFREAVAGKSGPVSLRLSSDDSQAGTVISVPAEM